jgi:hypothetical protein
MRSLLTILCMSPAATVSPSAPQDPQPVVLNDDGAWCWFQDERAVVANGTLWFGSVASGHLDPDRRGDIQVSSVDLSSGKLEGAAQKTWELHDQLQLDDHDVPALLVRSDQRVLAVYGKHGNDSKVLSRVSVSSDPNEGWGPEQVHDTKGAGVTYANLFAFPGGEGSPTRILDVHRGEGWDPNILASSDGGITWAHEGALLSGPGRPYLKYAQVGDDLHFLATNQHPRDFDNSVYHGILRGRDICKADGTVVGQLGESAPRPPQLTLVFEGAPDAVAWLVDVAISDVGEPLALLSIQTDGAGKPRAQGGLDHRFLLAVCNDAKWSTEQIAYAGTRLYAGEDDYTGLGAIDPHETGRFYISTDAHPITGKPLVNAKGLRRREIYAGDGKTWRALTRDSAHDNLRPIVPATDDPGQRVVLWLRGTYRSYGNYDLEVVGLLDARRPDYVPAGFELVAAQDFEGKDAVRGQRYTDSSAWSVKGADAQHWLELEAGGDYEPPHRSPHHLAILDAPPVGSFVLEVDLLQSGREYAHRDMVIAFGMRDPAHYVYAHLSTAADATAHHIHRVAAAPRESITVNRNQGVTWGRDQWHAVRVTYDAPSGHIAVYFDDMEHAVLTGTETSITSGHIGFGSYDDVGRIDNVRLWARPDFDGSRPEFFENH